MSPVVFRRVSSVPLVSRHGSFMQDFITLPLTSRMSYIFFFLCSSGNDAGSRSRITNTFICNQLLMRETERFHFLSSTVSATFPSWSTHNQPVYEAHGGTSFLYDFICIFHVMSKCPKISWSLSYRPPTKLCFIYIPETYILS